MPNEAGEIRLPHVDNANVQDSTPEFSTVLSEARAARYHDRLQRAQRGLLCSAIPEALSN